MLHDPAQSKARPPTARVHKVGLPRSRGTKATIKWRNKIEKKLMIENDSVGELWLFLPLKKACNFTDGKFAGRKYGRLRFANKKSAHLSWPIPAPSFSEWPKPKHQSKAVMAPRLQELDPAHWVQPKCLTGRAPENSATFGHYCPVPGRDGLLPPHKGCTTKSLSRPAFLPQEVAICKISFSGMAPCVSKWRCRTLPPKRYLGPRVENGDPFLAPCREILRPRSGYVTWIVINKSKICPTGPWSTIVVLMLHDSSSESCDDGHFIASTAFG